MLMTSKNRIQKKPNCQSAQKNLHYSGIASKPPAKRTETSPSARPLKNGASISARSKAGKQPAAASRVALLAKHSRPSSLRSSDGHDCEIASFSKLPVAGPNGVVTDQRGLPYPKKAQCVAVMPLKATRSEICAETECRVLVDENGRLLVAEVYSDYWNGSDWVEYGDYAETLESLKISSEDFSEKIPRRLRLFVRETDFDSLSQEVMEDMFSPEQIALIRKTRAPRTMEDALAAASLDQLLDAACTAAAERKVPLHNVRSALLGRDELGRKPDHPDQATILALLEKGWEDLTSVCDYSDDGKTERRLMRDPVGDFHIVSEHLDSAMDEWKVSTQSVAPARARHFYISTCIPESLATGFYEYEAPDLRLCTNLDEIEALMELMALYSTDDSIRGRTDGQRLKVGLHHLVRGTCDRARAAHDAI